MVLSIPIGNPRPQSGLHVSATLCRIKVSRRWKAATGTDRGAAKNLRARIAVSLPGDFVMRGVRLPDLAALALLLALLSGLPGLPRLSGLSGWRR